MKKISLIIAALLCTATAFAQGRSALKITEVMVENNTSVVDEYGEHVAWIEVFNSNFAPIEISSIYLTTDTANKKMYPVPLGDHRTKIGKRQYAVFYANTTPTRGTFHTNLKLNPGKTNKIWIYDANGKTLIDSITVPPIPADASYAVSEGEDGTIEYQVRDGSTEKLYITPGAPNKIKDENDKIQEFSTNDKHGFAMAVMAMCIVFSALLILSISFYFISKIGAAISRMNKAKSQGVATETFTAREVEHDSGEEIAAIVMALHEHLNAHDTESTILTINKVKRAYSPWSSKIYGLRQDLK